MTTARRIRPRMLRRDGRKIYEQRWVMEQHLGRRLRRDEFVFCINGDYRDVRIENMRIITASEYGRISRARGRRRVCAVQLSEQQMIGIQKRRQMFPREPVRDVARDFGVTVERVQQIAERPLIESGVA